jgi:DNA ligase-1
VPIDGLVEIEKELRGIRDAYAKDFVLDGELIVSDRLRYPSKEQYKRTTMIVRKDGVKVGVDYHVFDWLSTDAFYQRTCTTPYWERREMLETIVPYDVIPSTVHAYYVPVLYHGNDTSKIFEWLSFMRNKEREGVMINLADEPYRFTRTNALLKVKVMQDCDLRIIGVEEGNGKFAGTLGALVVDYKGNPVGVGSGITDDIRRMIWNDPSKYIGRVATIQYFEETNDKDGKKSIRFPVFKELREEGKEVSYE